MKKKSLVSVIAAMLIIAVSLSGCVKISFQPRPTEGTSQPTTQAPAYESTTSSPSQSGEDETTSSQGGQSQAYVTVPTYHPIDSEPFLTRCSELSELAKGNDAAAIISLYDELYAEYSDMDDNSNAAYIEYSRNVSDSSLAAAKDETDNQLTECQDAMLTACLAVTKGPCADAFREHVGDDDFESYAEYEAFTGEELQITKQINELCTKYYTEVDKVDSSETGSDAELVEAVGPIYMELVQLRTRLAQIHGYDSYTDYAYEIEYSREYTREDVEKFSSLVKKYSEDFYNLYYDDYFYSYYNGTATDDLSLNEILKALKTYGSKIDPVVDEGYEYLTVNHLYDIGEGSNRINSTYCAEFCGSNVPYIFATLGEGRNLDSVSHEFGHFIHFMLDPTPNPLFADIGDLDVAEIHSTGLEFLYSNFYEDIFGKDDGAALVNSLLLSDYVNCVINGCLINEFESKVYDNPDMTLDEICQAYMDACAAYNDPYTSSDDYWWTFVGHIFESPFYYISYATSTSSSLQIWQMSQTDFDGACAAWAQLVKTSYFGDEGYLQLTRAAGLAPITDTAAMESMIKSVLEYARAHTKTFSIDDIYGGLFGQNDQDSSLNPFGDSWDSYFGGSSDPFSDIFGNIFDGGNH